MATYLAIGTVIVLFYLMRTKQFDQDWEPDTIPELLLAVMLWPIPVMLILMDEW